MKTKVPESLRPQFLELAADEPRLLDLEQFAIHTAQYSPAAHRLRLFYDHIKPRVLYMVGWERMRGPAHLKTAEAYETGYRHTLYIMTVTEYRRTVTKARAAERRGAA